MRHGLPFTLVFFSLPFGLPRKSRHCFPKDVAALAQELSGETAKRNLEGITRFHRQRGSQGFHSAAELVAERARAYGLSEVPILQFPADGKIFYGTQRSRPPWDAEFAELWEMKKDPELLQVTRGLQRSKSTATTPSLSCWPKTARAPMSPRI